MHRVKNSKLLGKDWVSRSVGPLGRGPKFDEPNKKRQVNILIILRPKPKGYKIGIFSKILIF